jgi:trk system potassium uptake protein TrkA
MDVLIKAGVEGADAFIAVTDGDNRNIMASQIAKRVFNVPTVLTRVYDPVRASVFQKHGIHVLCTTSMAAGFFRDIIEGNACDTFAEQLQAYLDASEIGRAHV